MLKKITKVEALMLGKKHKINFDVIDFSEWHAGLNIELEHQNLTKGSLEKDDSYSIGTFARISKLL